MQNTGDEIKDAIKDDTSSIVHNQTQNSSCDSAIDIGPRHKKLVQAYNKTMEMIVQKCSLEQVRSVFPPILGEIPSHMEDECGADDIDLVQLAYSKSMKVFIEKVGTQWESMIEEMQVFLKLDSLDHMMKDQDRGKPCSDLVHSTTPSELYTRIVSSMLERDIQKMDQELQHIQSENDLLRNQISERQKEFIKVHDDLDVIQKHWDEAFQAASQLESDLKIPCVMIPKEIE